MDMAQSTLSAGTAQKFQYEGRLGALYWIFIKNVLLGLLTFSIYRFWGKTNLRRYIWSHMRFQGQTLEYTGTGGELFKGFLIVIGFLILVQLVIFGLTVSAGPDSPLSHVVGVIFAIAVLYLAMVAIYAAQRYRLTRTLWCGIRGGMTGSAWTFGFRAIGYNLLASLTLSLAGPWAQMRLTEIRINNSYFGDAKAYLKGSAGAVFLSYLIGLLIYLAIVVVGSVVLWFGLDLPSVFRAVFDGEFDAEREAMIGTFVVAYLLFLAIFLVAGVFAFCWYAAAFFRIVASGLTFSDLTFRSTMGAGDYLRLWLGNIAILVLTLGLGLPIIVHRSLRFFADRLEVFGEVDVERLQQNTLPKPKTGEGLLETFDPGFL